MTARRAEILIAFALTACLSVAAGCGNDREPLRVGVLLECSGPFGATAAGARAGASLPLLQRGARRGDAPGEIEQARIAGVPVVLVPACTEVAKFSRLISETRWLIESQHVDVVVGPLGTPDGVVMRRLAHRYPGVTFLVGSGVAQEVTLKDPQANLFRFTPDGPQMAAGLGAYAFDTLGWRRAVVVAEGYVNGLEQAAGFVAEFCALGGTVVERDYGSLFAPDPGAAARRHARTADGVALISSAFSPVPYLQSYSAAVGPRLAGRLVLSGPPFYDRANLAPPGVDLTGVVLGGFVPLDPAVRSMSSFRAALEAAYPELPAGAATNDPTFSSYAAVEAIASALEATGGELGEGQERLRHALGDLELELPYGTVRVDDNRQAVVNTSLEKIRRASGGGAVLQRIHTVEGVEQGFGGIFTSETASPTWAEPTCAQRSPPPWAR